MLNDVLTDDKRLDDTKLIAEGGAQIKNDV
jgi:hypothetical protein